MTPVKKYITEELAKDDELLDDYLYDAWCNYRHGEPDELVIAQLKQIIEALEMRK